jgi:hypothetical protein
MNKASWGGKIRSARYEMGVKTVRRENSADMHMGHGDLFFFLSSFNGETGPNDVSQTHMHP